MHALLLKTLAKFNMFVDAVASKIYKYIGTPKQFLKWKDKLSGRQVGEILEVVSWFGLDFYTAEPEPDYDALREWGVAVG